MSPSSSHARGVTPVAAYARLAANAAVANGGTVLLDTTNFDSAGYFNAVTHQLVVPTGLAGLHQVGFMLIGDVAAAGTFAEGSANNSGSDANAFFGLAQYGTAGASKHWAGGGSLVVNAAVGDTFTLVVSFDGGGNMTVVGGGNGSVLWIVYLGAGS